jgi:hypothetical protein
VEAVSQEFKDTMKTKGGTMNAGKKMPRPKNVY